MQTENIYSINNYLNSRQLKLFDFMDGKPNFNETLENSFFTTIIKN